MLHGRHDRKIEEDGRANHRVDPMRLARIQQSNSKNFLPVDPANAREDATNSVVGGDLVEK
jgi:hypothetical protein